MYRYTYIYIYIYNLIYLAEAWRWPCFMCSRSRHTQSGPLAWGHAAIIMTPTMTHEM